MRAEVADDPLRLTWTLPRMPEQDTAAARQLATDLRELALLLRSHVGQADVIIAALRASWAGAGAAAAPEPLAQLRQDTDALQQALEEAAARLERFARDLDAAADDHDIAWRKIAVITTGVVVTAAVVTVTVASAGTAAPAAVAAEGAVVGAAAAQMSAASAGAAASSATLAAQLAGAARLAGLVQGLRAITVPRLYIAATKVPIAVETPLGGAVVGGGTTAVLQYADDGRVHPADVALGALLGGGENAAIGGRGWSARRHPIGSAADLRLMARPRERAKLLDRATASAPQDQRPYERDAKPLQTHFKHAKHFGVTGNWNKHSVNEFDDALRRFVAAPGTVRIDGTWKKQPAVIYADYDRRLTLVCHPDGRYWTAQPSTGAQYWWLWYTHRLGGS